MPTPIKPNIKKKVPALFKQCGACGETFDIGNFPHTKSPFYPDGYLPLCGHCISEFLKSNDYSWESVDSLCRCADLPFIPKEWENLRQKNSDEAQFLKYAEIFLQEEFDGLGWKDYDAAFRDLRDRGLLEEQLPELAEKREKKLREKWGSNYDYESLIYLENLYEGLLQSQTVNGALQYDQAIKICKISFAIDEAIRSNENFDKLLTSYDKLVKVAEFTPKNAKNLNDFDSVGELLKWLEKRGWRNPYYDNEKRDVVDETIENIQAFNRRLYVNESSIGDSITKRLEALNMAKDNSGGNYYTDDSDYDLEFYEQAGYEELLGEEGDFEA